MTQQQRAGRCVAYALDAEDADGSACLVIDGYGAGAAETHPFDDGRVATLGGESTCLRGAPRERSVTVTIPEDMASVRLVARLGAASASSIGDVRFSEITLVR